MSQIDQSSHYLYNGNTVNIIPGKNMLPKRILDVGTYEVQADPDKGYYLNKIPDMVVPETIYGDCPDVAKRVVKTYLDRKCNTGVLLEGEQGSGKTMLAKIVSKALADLDIPTIVINKDYYGPGFNAFMASIDCPCLVFFDEFEKTYYDNNAKNSILTFFDGVFDSNKLIICTVNDKNRLSVHMLNRPGRLYYSISYNRLDDETVSQYVNKNLINKSYSEEVVKASVLLGGYNFDVLQAVVEEMNRYDCSLKEAIKYLNIKPSKNKYSTGVKYLVVSSASDSRKLYISSTLTDLPSGTLCSDYLSSVINIDEDSPELLSKLYSGEYGLDKVLNFSDDDVSAGFYRILCREDDMDSFNTSSGIVRYISYDGTSLFIPIAAEKADAVTKKINISNEKNLRIPNL